MAKKPLNAPQSRIHESEPMVIEIEVEDATVAILEAISSSFKFQDIYLGELGTFRSLLVSKAFPISSQRVKTTPTTLNLKSCSLGLLETVDGFVFKSVSGHKRRPEREGLFSCKMDPNELAKCRTCGEWKKRGAKRVKTSKSKGEKICDLNLRFLLRPKNEQQIQQAQQVMAEFDWLQIDGSLFD